MLDTAIKLLAKITEKGYEAYLVGGFVRDYLLGIKTNDIDVTIIKIFVASVIILLMNSTINPPSLLSHNTLQFVQQHMRNYGYNIRTNKFCQFGLNFW